MAALLLSFAGASAGSALFGATGAIAGRLIGAVAGSVADQALFGGGARKHREGPRLADLDVMGSTEGAAIPRVYGRARMAGQVIWATRLEEVKTTRSESAGGGKGGGPRVTTTTYAYFANFAAGLCEGPIAGVGRIWADGKQLDRAQFDIRVYRGDEEQLLDPLIEAKEAEGDAPAYRGLAYLVFERFPLANYGNRIPQIAVEVLRRVGRLENMIRAVTIIPGATEFGYDTLTVLRAAGQGVYAPENRHIASADSDWTASLDELQAVCPNLERVALVVAWFGSDLRAGHCEVRPKVDRNDKQTHGATWSVAGLSRASAQAVSLHDERPAFGGTPSDASVVRAIQDLNTRGLEVMFYPFVMMDVAADNELPDPYGGDSQPAYPWRGQITCDPAPGMAETVDGTSAAADQVAALFGAAAPEDFSACGMSVTYSGPAEWSLRRMVLHYAKLCAAAGGVESFLIGSEYEALTRVRSASGVYPAAVELVSLAADVKEILGSETKVSYAANWSEYGAHSIDDGNELRFPLDPLWASEHIDFIGVDYYAPLADWRDGGTHEDASLAESIYEPDYLKTNLRAGEFYDFYYVDAEARAAQTRAAIADGLGKPWVYRAKDLWNFWSEPHIERVAGSELGAPTAWIPESKPFRFTEVGCPAVDKGANQPNVFPDTKSAQEGYPYFSNRRRDDLVQRRYLEAAIGGFDPALGASEDDNPISSINGARMVDVSGMFAWTWDARPYPAFPLAEDVWSDGPNWQTGHWLNGRLGAAPLDDLIGAMLADHGAEDTDTSRLRGAVDGYVIDRPMSARAAIEPVAAALGFDAAEEEGTLRFRPRGGTPVATLSEEELAAENNDPECRLTRAQETELPVQVALGFTEVAGDFRRAAVVSRRLSGASRREARAELALITSDSVAERAADIWLQDLWAGRERAEFSLLPSRIALSPGDVVDLDYRGRVRRLEITEVTDLGARAVKARSIDLEIFNVAARPPRASSVEVPALSGPPTVYALDIALPAGEAEPPLQYFAVHASPWPGAMAVWRSADGASFERIALVPLPAIVGATLDELPAGGAHRWDRANSFRVKIASGALSAQTDSRVLGGANAAAVRKSSGGWEVLQFANAELVEENIYLLSRLLRGQQGSEAAMAEACAAGAPFVLLDDALTAVARSPDLIGRSFQYRAGPASDDVASPRMTALESTVGANALKPWRPAHLRAVRGEGGVEISWIRRTRAGGDAWEVLEVPLGEESERYRIEILDGAEIVRTIETVAPSALYEATDELGDFGSAQSSLTFRVAQLSALAGGGHARTATINL